MSPTQRAAASAEFVVTQAAESCCQTGQDTLGTSEVSIAESVEFTEVALGGVESVLATELTTNVENWALTENAIQLMAVYPTAALVANKAGDLVAAERAISESLFVEVQDQLTQTFNRAFATLQAVESNIPGQGLPSLAQLQAAESLVVTQDICSAERAVFTENACPPLPTP